jgi:hypothetical protein
MTQHVTLQDHSFRSGSAQDEYFSRSRGSSLRKRSFSRGDSRSHNYRTVDNLYRPPQFKQNISGLIDQFENTFLDYINVNYKKFTEKDLKTFIQTNLKNKLIGFEFN